MKVQASPNLSGYFNDPYSHQPSKEQDDVVEMVVEDGIAFVPTPLPMLGNRLLDVSGIILEDQVLPSARLVSAKYEAAGKLTRLTTGVISKGG